MIDEMYDRAWGEHHRRFSQDVHALLRKAGRALRPVFRRRMSSDGESDIPGSARIGGDCAGVAARSGAADIGCAMAGAGRANADGPSR